MKKLNNSTLNLLRSRLNTELAKLEKEFGLKLEVGAISYTQHYATAKLKISTISDDGKVITKVAQDWSFKASWHNLHKAPGKLFEAGDKVIIDGVTYKIVGWNTRNRKYPIILQKQDGKQIKCTIGFFKKHK